MPFCWEEDPRAEAEGVVLAVDVTRHASQVGFQGPTFVSRGLWVRLVGAGPGQKARLLDMLAGAGQRMTKPLQASDDGAAVLFELGADTGPTVEVISITSAERNGLTLMLRREFTRPTTGAMLRVRVVAEDDTRPRA